MAAELEAVLAKARDVTDEEKISVIGDSYYRWGLPDEASAITDEGLVERVARALADQQWDAACTALGTPNMVRGSGWEHWVPAAEAALAASGHTALLREIEARQSSGFFAAAEEIMHFINSLDSDGMDANAVRSAIYHKCLEMRPRAALSRPLDETYD